MTCRSCIASSSAACVLGGVRLISSASTMLAKIGPSRKRNSRVPVALSSWITSVPVMSAGIRSGVNWMRLKSSDSASASVRISSVLARPGTPTSRQWPRANMAIKQLLDHVVLADDHLAKLARESLVGVAQVLNVFEVVIAEHLDMVSGKW